jgi:hypothetical protein
MGLSLSACLIAAIVSILFAPFAGKALSKAITSSGSISTYHPFTFLRGRFVTGTLNVKS